MKTCSAGTVMATITKLIPKKVDLRVKRKTKTSQNNKHLWWFVLYGTESDLIYLESEWEKVQNHTLWTLHNCLMTPKVSQPMASTTTTLVTTPAEQVMGEPTQTHQETPTDHVDETLTMITDDPPSTTIPPTPHSHHSFCLSPATQEPPPQN